MQTVKSYRQVYCEEHGVMKVAQCEMPHSHKNRGKKYNVNVDVQHKDRVEFLIEFSTLILKPPIHH